MGSPNTQADGNWCRYHRGHVRQSKYHQYLKRGRARWIRRLVKLMCRREEEPPSKIGYRGWES
jgi:hypothetical protein